jgi:hypothetical protein
MDDMFRYFYRSAALQCHASFSYRTGQPGDYTNYQGSVTKIILRNGSTFIEPDEGQTPQASSVSQNVVAGEFAQFPFISGRMISSVQPPSGSSYTMESSFSFSLKDGSFLSAPYFLGGDGKYHCPFLSAQVGGLTHGITGSVFGSAFRIPQDPDSPYQNASGIINISFSGGDLPLF